MKKILEYKVYDLLKDKDNEKFLDKVKKENPDLYAQFISILGNKGLEVAKQKYQEYDPEYIKMQEEKEKKDKLRRKKENTKENRIEHTKQILSDLKPKIDIIQSILSDTPLKKISSYMENDKRISDYLNNYGIRKVYTNNLKILLKKPSRLAFELNYSTKIDSLQFVAKSYTYWGVEESQNIIKIEQYYNYYTKDTIYSIHFNLFDKEDDIYYLPKIDSEKESEFLIYRNRHIKTLDNNRVELGSIFSSLKQFSKSLDEEYYNEWKLNQDANKYNL